jgi:4-amino-4-deoxychorismate lyase
MSRFLETIRCRNGVLENLPYHQERLDRTRRHHFGPVPPLRLAEEIRVRTGLEPETPYRCRVVYGREVESVEFIPYQLKPIRALQLVIADDLDYAFKYANRAALDGLRAGLPADEEVLLVKNGLLTDTTYANVALFDGSLWYTPHQPLLEGTRRAQLLAEGRLVRERLTPEDLRFFQKIRLFNAMIPWEMAPEITVEAVRGCP